MAPSARCAFIWSHRLPMNWWGMTKTMTFAPLTASTMSGTASWWQQSENCFKQAEDTTLPGRSLTTKAHGTTWAQLYRRAPVAHKQTKSITYWRKYPLKQPDLNTHHVLGQFVARQIFDVLMLCVYDLCQLTALNDLLINPHVDHRVEAVGRFDVVPDDFGDGRTPEGEEGWNISYFWFAAVA